MTYVSYVTGTAAHHASMSLHMLSDEWWQQVKPVHVPVVFQFGLPKLPNLHECEVTAAGSMSSSKALCAKVPSGEVIKVIHMCGM